MSLKPWPVLTLLMEGGPDDGLIIHVEAGDGPEPPEEIVTAADPLGGCYRRLPDPVGERIWTYSWSWWPAITMDA